MGFYNVATGMRPTDELARKYTLNDNYHQPVMGGTFANMMMFGYRPPCTMPTPTAIRGTCRQPDREPQRAGRHQQLVYAGRLFGRQLHQLLRPVAAGRGADPGHLASLHVPSQCAPGAFYLLNNYVPAFIGSGATDPVNNGPFTLPPVKKAAPHRRSVERGWRVVGFLWRALERLQDRPRSGRKLGSLDPIAYLYWQHLQSVSVLRFGHDRRHGSRGAQQGCARPV